MRKRARRRRLRLYVVGLGGSGTTSLTYIFGNYRSAHECEPGRMVPLTNAARYGDMTPARRRWEMRRRSLRFGLEVDSAAFLSPFVPELAELYPRARFVVMIRDCFSWMDTRLEKWLRSGVNLTTTDDLRAQFRWTEYGVVYAVAPSPEDAPLVDRDLPPVGTLAKRWAAAVSDVLTTAPPDRTLVVRTEDIDTSIERLAQLCSVDASTLVRGVHRNAAPRRERLLSQVSREHVLHQAEQWCAPLMEQFWGPEWRMLVDRVSGWDAPTEVPT